MKAWRIGALIFWLATLALFALFMGLFGSSAVLAQVPPWPTPPPAPLGAFPEVIPASQITPVPAPASPGSIALQVDPIFAGPIPRIPPRPSIVIATGESDEERRITMYVDAGAIDRTLQFTYEPLSADQWPAASLSWQIQRAFRLQTYDHTASVVDRAFKYPVRITLNVSEQELAAAGGDPARLYVAQFDSQQARWIPLVTTYSSINGTLLVRILQSGLFALIAQPSPLPR